MTGKILFVVPRNKSLFGDEISQTSHPHVGVAYLVSFLKEKGIQTAIFDEGIEQSEFQLIEKIDNFKPDLIGISIFSYSYGFAKNLLKIIKSKYDIPVVAGGPHVSAIRSKILENTYIDFAIKNEGEYPLLALIEEMSSVSCELNRINGLIWRKGGEVFENPDGPYIEDLDALPFPDYEAFNIKRYPCYKGKTLPLITSRGCPFGCNYCSVRLSMGQNFRPRSAENVFAEMQRLYEQGWKSFDINDDCFSLDKTRAGRICELITEHKLKIRFQLYNGIRVDTVNLDLLRKMKQSGCYFISYGCEAGSDKVLKAIKKGITLDQVRDAVRWTNQVGISNSVNFIIGNKEETYQDALGTLRFAESLPTSFVNFYNLMPYPGTESFEWAKQHATFLIPPEEFLENISYRDNQPIFQTPEFTKEQRQQVITLGFKLYRKKILTFRLGKVLGSLIYSLTNFNVINRLATRFALTNPLGKFIYLRLAAKSFAQKEEIGNGDNRTSGILVKAKRNEVNMGWLNVEERQDIRISICIPTYNRSDLLKKTLISVDKQTVKPYEVIVADNCPGDDTESVAKSFPGVIYYRNERNLGLAGNSNRCIQLAKGEFVTILHSDDLISPYWHEYWLSVLSRYKANQDIAVFFSSTFTIDVNDKAKIVYRVFSDERVLAQGEAFNVLWSRNMFGLPASGSTIFRKSIFDDIGAYAEELSIESDALLVLRILNNYSIFHSPRLLYAFRLHPFQAFDKAKQEKTIDKKLSVLKRHLNIFKDFYNNELKPTYRYPMFYKRVALMYISIALFYFITLKKDLAKKYYRITNDIFPDTFNNPGDYFVFVSMLFHYFKKLLWGRVLALPIRNMACKWIKD